MTRKTRGGPFSELDQVTSLGIFTSLIHLQDDGPEHQVQRNKGGLISFLRYERSHTFLLETTMHRGTDK